MAETKPGVERRRQEEKGSRDWRRTALGRTGAHTVGSFPKGNKARRDAHPERRPGLPGRLGAAAQPANIGPRPFFWRRERAEATPDPVERAPASSSSSSSSSSSATVAASRRRLPRPIATWRPGRSAAHGVSQQPGCGRRSASPWPAMSSEMNNEALLLRASGAQPRCGNHASPLRRDTEVAHTEGRRPAVVPWSARPVCAAGGQQQSRARASAIPPVLSSPSSSRPPCRNGRWCYAPRGPRGIDIRSLGYHDLSPVQPLSPRRFHAFSMSPFVGRRPKPTSRRWRLDWSAERRSERLIMLSACLFPPVPCSPSIPSPHPPVAD
jgi:hypothetical protein